MNTNCIYEIALKLCAYLCVFVIDFWSSNIEKKNVLGDGDSSVTKRLNEILPYGPGLRVEKIECRNHMLRNYSQKMSALTKRTEFPILIGKKIADNLVRLRTDITKKLYNIENLRKNHYNRKF
jgi:hypothetical protein